MSPKEPTTSTMRSLERAIDVLEVLEASRVPLRLSEVARRAGLHVATAQRILNILEARDRVDRENGGYTMGVSMLFGAHAYLATNRIATAAPLLLQQLAAATGLTASVFVRAGKSRAVVARIEGDDPLRYVLPIGERLPLHLGAGKVLAAYMDQAELEQVLGALSFSRADKTVVTLEEFKQELRSIREQGWVHSRDERVVGAASVCAPVISPNGECVAAIQVSGTSQNNIFDNAAALGEEVRLAASALSSRLG